MRNLEGCVSDFPCLLTEDGSQESLLGSQLSLALRSNLSYEDIAGVDFGADSYDTFLIQILQSIFTHIRNVSGDLFRSQLGVSGFGLILLDVDGREHVFHDESLIEDDGVLVVVSFPRHEADEKVLAQGYFAVGR